MLEEDESNQRRSSFPQMRQHLEKHRNFWKTVLNSIGGDIQNCDGEIEFPNVLLVRQILVRGNEHVEFRLGSGENCSVFECTPAELSGGFDLVTRKRAT